MFFILVDPEKFLQILLNAERTSRGVRRGGAAARLDRQQACLVRRCHLLCELDILSSQNTRGLIHIMCQLDDMLYQSNPQHIFTRHCMANTNTCFENTKRLIAV